MPSLTLPERVSRLEAAHPHHAAVTFQQALAGARLAFADAAEFLDYYTRIDSDFIYDATSGIYLIEFGLAGERHEPAMAALWQYYNEANSDLDRYEMADRYILDGLGMFKSTAGPYIYRGASFAVPSALHTIQRDVRVLFDEP